MTESTGSSEPSGPHTGHHTGPPTEPTPRVEAPARHRALTRLVEGRRRIPRPTRRAVLLGAAALVVAGVVLGIVNPFSTPSVPTNSKSYSTYTVKLEDLSSQTQVTATLGFAGAYTVSAPAGTSSQNLMQDQQAVTEAQTKVRMDESSTTAAGDAASVAAAEQSLTADKAALGVDESTVQSATSALAAAQQKEANDCSGSGSTSSTCASDQQQVENDQQKVSADEQTVSQGTAKVSQDESSLSQARLKESQDAAQAQSTLTSDEQSLADAQAALAAAQEEATIQGGAFSELPAAGQVVSEGQTLYTVGTTPVVLLYGTTPATRNLYEGESGPDVAQLNDDLRALGYTAPSGDTFTGATATAVDAFQAHIGVAQTGNLALGQVVFLPTAARVTAVSGVLGSDAQPGAAVLTASSTQREVSIALDANLQSDVKVGDAVTITLPNLSITAGVVSYVGTVATVPTSSGNTRGTQSSTPTITVDVTPSDPSAISKIDQAPVSVSITNATVHNALVVPVDALLALEGGGYALEVVPAHGAHYLVAAKTGLFDDADGLVQVTGSGIHVGMRVVVPST